MLEPFLDTRFYDDPNWLSHLALYCIFYFLAILGLIQVLEKLWLRILTWSKRYKDIKEAIEKAWDNMLVRELKRMDVLKDDAEKRAIKELSKQDAFMEDLKNDARPNDIAQRFKDNAQNRKTGNKTTDT